MLFWPWRERFEPPLPAASLAESAEVMPAPRFVHKHETTLHIIWLGPIYNSTVSDRAIYVFDQNQSVANSVQIAKHLFKHVRRSLPNERW